MTDQITVNFLRSMSCNSDNREAARDLYENQTGESADDATIIFEYPNGQHVRVWGYVGKNAVLLFREEMS